MLLDEAMTDCVMMDKVSVPDGEGGFGLQWQDGAKIKVAIVFDNSMQARTAEAQGVKSLYTITTRRNVVLEFHDVIRRLSDGKIFRITSDGDDKFTPASSTLDMRQVTAEEWQLS